MDKYVPKELTGSLFKNDKGDNEKRPDYRGDAMINGELMEMAAWIRKSQSGVPFMSIQFKPKEEQAAKPQAKKQAAVEMEDDQIPF